MVSTRLMAMALVVVWCCSMTASEQHWKYSKPYTWMSSPKSYSPSYPAVYGKPLPRSHISSGYDKHRDRCELRKAVFTQDAESPQVRANLRWFWSSISRSRAAGRDRRPATLTAFRGRLFSIIICTFSLRLFSVHRLQDQNPGFERIHAVPLAQHLQLHSRPAHILVYE